MKIAHEKIIFGELVVLSKGDVATCDLVVIQGSAIVNEFMLTGDCLPIPKSPLPNN